MIKRRRRDEEQDRQKKNRGEKKLVVDWLLESNSAANSKGVWDFFFLSCGE
jgi:hypothetical protein